MNKKGNLIAAALLAAVAGSALAQAQGPAQAQPQPTAPVAVAPVSAPAAQPTAAVPEASSPNATQVNRLRQISERKAELDLLRVDAEIEKLKKPKEEAAKKEEAASVQREIERARQEQKAAAPAEVEVPISLLATFGTPGRSNAGYAELKVGDLLVQARVGDRLPSGHYVKAINFDSVEISKVKKPTSTRGNKVIYISASDTANVYGGRARSGVSTEPAAGAAAAGAPGALPPIPGAR